MGEKLRGKKAGKGGVGGLASRQLGAGKCLSGVGRTDSQKYSAPFDDVILCNRRRTLSLYSFACEKLGEYRLIVRRHEEEAPIEGRGFPPICFLPPAESRNLGSIYRVSKTKRNVIEKWYNIIWYIHIWKRWIDDRRDNDKEKTLLMLNNFKAKTKEDETKDDDTKENIK